MPESLRDVKWSTLDKHSLAACAQEVVIDASRHLARSAEGPPPAAARKTPAWAALSGATDDDEPVRIVGVHTEGVGRPANDGTRGSALYRVPLQLNRVPPSDWAAAFPNAWNNPSAWTSMHRPGIASLAGDRIVLDGTTIDELERYHLVTLKLVVNTLNEHVAQARASERAQGERDAREAAEHDRQVRESVQRLRFDS